VFLAAVVLGVSYQNVPRQKHLFCSQPTAKRIIALNRVGKKTQRRRPCALGSRKKNQTSARRKRQKKTSREENNGVREKKIPPAR
jgi:hypothetical protein